MRTIYESSGMNGIAHVSCVKYKNLNNIAHYHKDHELVYVCEGNAFVSVKENFFHLKNKNAYSFTATIFITYNPTKIRL